MEVHNTHLNKILSHETKWTYALKNDLKCINSSLQQDGEMTM